jgi:hypothetical protein
LFKSTENYECTPNERVIELETVTIVMSGYEVTLNKESVKLETHIVTVQALDIYEYSLSIHTSDILVSLLYNKNCK